jgi:hypothetical protein
MDFLDLCETFLQLKYCGDSFTPICRVFFQLSRDYHFNISKSPNIMQLPQPESIFSISVSHVRQFRDMWDMNLAGIRLVAM